MNEDETKDNSLNRDFHRNECDDDYVHPFLLLLKIPNRLTPDNEEEMQESE